ncbi:MAG: leucine-rich repeat domain-containing protein, partial [Bacilli bacterium]|nr:leucine-rich repeat domain-containing protein [Bacilli bacterium]
MKNVDKREWDIKGTRLERYLGASEEIVIPNGVESIDKYAFNDYRRNHHYPIKKLTIPGTVKIIPVKLFKNFPIEELVLEEGIVYIDKYAFTRSKIKKLTLPSTIKRIDDYAFCDCDLTELILNEGIEEIGSSAFLGNQLTRIVFPKTLPRICLNTFHSEGKVTNLDIVCHFSHIDDNIYGPNYPITCNLFVIVDNDFNYFVFYDFIRDIKRKKLANMDIKKITLIGYTDLISKVPVANAGIELEMKDKNEIVIKELLGAKTEKKEIVDSNSRDAEIDELVNGIKEKSNILEEGLKASIIAKVDDLVKKYQKDLEGLKPKLETENKIVLGIYQTPQSLRTKLITDLETINMNFISLDANFYLKEK